MGLNVITSPTTFTGGLSASWDNIITSQPLLSSLAGTEEILISDGIVSKKTTAQAIADLGGGGGSITTSTTPPVSPSAGDLWFNSESGILYVYYDDGNSQQWVAADNSGSGGKVAQVVRSSTSTTALGTTVIPFDGTTPQNTEGTELLTVTIVPTNASSMIELEFRAWGTANANMGIVLSIFKDSNANALDSSIVNTNATDHMTPFILSTSVTAGSTSAQTYKIRIGNETGAFGTTWYFLRRAASSTNPLNGKAWLIAREILP